MMFRIYCKQCKFEVKTEDVNVIVRHLDEQCPNCGAYAWVEE